MSYKPVSTGHGNKNQSNSINTNTNNFSNISQGKLSLKSSSSRIPLTDCDDENDNNDDIKNSYTIDKIEEHQQKQQQQWLQKRSLSSSSSKSSTIPSSPKLTRRRADITAHSTRSTTTITPIIRVVNTSTSSNISSSSSNNNNNNTSIKNMEESESDDSLLHDDDGLTYHHHNRGHHAVLSTLDDDDNDDHAVGGGMSGEGDGIFFQPLEISSSPSISTDHHHLHHHHPIIGVGSKAHLYSDIAGGTTKLVLLFDWKDPWLPSVALTLLFTVPIVVGNIVLFHDLFGQRRWIATPFALHLLLCFASARMLVSSSSPPLSSVVSNSSSNTDASFLQGRICRMVASFTSLIDIILLACLYPILWRFLIDNLFTEIDGTTVVEWTNHKKRLQIYEALAFVAAITRGFTGTVAIVMRLFTIASWAERFRACHYRILLLPLVCVERFVVSTKFLVSPRTQSTVRNSLRWLLNAGTVIVLIVVTSCGVSAANHLLATWPPPPTKYTNQESITDHSECDPLDSTECWLPFPSFHHMITDSTSLTGWRVNFKANVLPTLKGGIPINLQPNKFVNNLDGFSTMAPLLFYIDGLKEAHEGGIGQLQGPSNISKSITDASITILVNVNTKSLVAHSAEIDYKDNANPLVMVFPAQPLAHNTHYALAVVNAVDVTGKRLPPTKGMTMLFHSSVSSLTDPQRRERYLTVVIPAIEEAAGPVWFNYTNDPDSLQLLFDYSTISEKAQLGPIRGVRDATMKYISKTEWKWSDHVRTNKVIDRNCGRKTDSIARTVHAELDVPWFLTSFGPGNRNAMLNPSAVRSGIPTCMGIAKFVVHIPCSVRVAALVSGGNGGSPRSAKPIRAVMEYGHGLFANRGEASDDFLLKIANEEGYIITAMDWRGMSVYDFPIVVKTLLSTPTLFESIRDNLIQGYANKYALQHFSRNAMLAMEWLQFTKSRINHEDSTVSSVLVSAPTLNNQQPQHVFYGNSQGGILGAGYSALSGVTGLIDKSILGVPGTPFAFIMARSLDFKLYDAVMLLNFYDNRHVRMFLNIAQMMWDSVEASGVLAPPVHEPFPRTLMQAGLGDAIVPAFAAEVLARSFNASVLPSHPRKDIYGIQTANNFGMINNSLIERNDTMVDGITKPLQAVLTELLYPSEYGNLPADNKYPVPNMIHICVRMDSAMIDQLKEFINSGNIINPCVDNGCIRSTSKC